MLRETSKQTNKQTNEKECVVEDLAVCLADKIQSHLKGNNEDTNGGFFTELGVFGYISLNVRKRLDRVIRCCIQFASDANFTSATYAD